MQQNRHRRRIFVHIRRHQNILSSNALQDPYNRRICRPTAGIPKYPCTLARTSDSSDRGGEAFCEDSTDAGTSGRPPPICILVSASLRKGARREGYSAVVWVMRLNYRKRTTSRQTESSASGAKWSRNNSEIFLTPTGSMIARRRHHIARRRHADFSCDCVHLQIRAGARAARYKLGACGSNSSCWVYAV